MEKISIDLIKKMNEYQRLKRRFLLEGKKLDKNNAINILKITEDEYEQIDYYVNKEDKKETFNIMQQEPKLTKKELSKLKENLSLLDSKYKDVLSYKYGFDDGIVKNAENVVRKFHISVLRVKQMEAREIRRVRHPEKFRKLKDFLNTIE